MMPDIEKDGNLPTCSTDRARDIGVLRVVC